MLDGARAATVAAQRNALLAQAAQRMDEQQLFIALTAPIRWSLVSDRVQGFATNRFARHTFDLAWAKNSIGIAANDRQDTMPGLGTDPASVRQRVEALEKIMERLIVIPGIKQRVGLDVILDLVPFAGSTAAAVLGAYMAWEARNLGMSKGADGADGRQYRG